MNFFNNNPTEDDNEHQHLVLQGSVDATVSTTANSYSTTASHTSEGNGAVEVSLDDHEPPRQSIPEPPTELPKAEIVELATLSLPKLAMETGLEVGEMNHVVLEASNEIVEHIQQAMNQHYGGNNDDGFDNDDDDDEQNDHHTNRTSNTTTIDGGTRATSTVYEPPSISAVVDLEKLSELVGATEVDLITGLQHEMQENRAAAAAAAAATASEVEEEEGKEADEETPLISPASPKTSSTEAVASSSEHTSSGQVQLSMEEETGTEQITLLADPFIETLAEVLPPIQEHYDTATFAGDTLYGEAITVNTTTVNTVVGGPDEGTVPEADEHVEEQHFGHDAFLLDVPTTDEQGNLEHHFVLALPEILVEESVQTETSALSGDEGSFYFMERAMSLLPTTARLPTDIENVHLEATEHIPTKTDPSQVHLDIVVERRVPIIGYVILLSGLFALASVGAALDLQGGGVTPTMKTLWRQIATSIVLFPLVVKSLLQDGKPHLTISQWSLLPVSAIAYAYMTLAFVIALEMTTLANAFVLSNMTSLVIIAGRFLLGMTVLPMEGGGAITGFVGAAVCANDAARTLAKAKAGVDHAGAVEADIADVSNTPSSNLAMWGNIVALSASFGTAAYLLIAKKLRPKMDLFVFMFIIMACGSVFLLFVMVASGEELSFGLHPVHGIFGWLNLQADRLPLELFMAIICNCLGTTGYIAVMKYFDPIVPATVMLLEPVIGALLGVAAGTARLPGLQTWLGDLVVAGGTFLVIYSGARKKECIDATEALRPRLATITEESMKSPSSVIKSPLMPRNSPALSKASRQRKQSSDLSRENPTPKVIWDV